MLSAYTVLYINSALCATFLIFGSVLFYFLGHYVVSARLFLRLELLTVGLRALLIGLRELFSL